MFSVEKGPDGTKMRFLKFYENLTLKMFLIFMFKGTVA